MVAFLWSSLDVFPAGCRSVCTISSRGLLNQSLLIAAPSNQLLYRVNKWRACTYCTVLFHKVALKKKKTTMFVWTCVRRWWNNVTDASTPPLSLKQTDSVCRERRGRSLSLFILWTGLYWTTTCHQTGWTLNLLQTAHPVVNAAILDRLICLLFMNFALCSYQYLYLSCSISFRQTRCWGKKATGYCHLLYLWSCFCVQELFSLVNQPRP